MTRSARLKLWRSTIMAMYLSGWLPGWQAHGGTCFGQGRSHVGAGMEGAFLCARCGRVVLRAEGRWWE